MHCTAYKLSCSFSHILYFRRVRGFWIGSQHVFFEWQQRSICPSNRRSQFAIYLFDLSLPIVWLASSVEVIFTRLQRPISNQPIGLLKVEGGSQFTRLFWIAKTGYTVKIIKYPYPYQRSKYPIWKMVRALGNSLEMKCTLQFENPAC